MKNHDKRGDRPILKEILITSVQLLLIVLFILVIIKYVGQRTEVHGTSMVPMLNDGDQLVVEKISRRFVNPSRYDIVVFPFKEEIGVRNYIKRIIGMPGESIRIDLEGRIYINEELLLEGYGSEVIKDPGIAISGIKLGDDEYFVLGDNRNNSKDSRDPNVGVIHRDIIIGKAWLKLLPLDEFGLIEHR